MVLSVQSTHNLSRGMLVFVTLMLGCYVRKLVTKGKGAIPNTQGQPTTEIYYRKMRQEPATPIFLHI
jgi:hypothetical protein